MMVGEVSRSNAELLKLTSSKQRAGYLDVANCQAHGLQLFHSAS